MIPTRRSNFAIWSSTSCAALGALGFGVFGLELAAASPEPVLSVLERFSTIEVKDGLLVSSGEKLMSVSFDVNSIGSCRGLCYFISVIHRNIFIASHWYDLRCQSLC